jgi:hypothetical protein
VTDQKVNGDIRVPAVLIEEQGKLEMKGRLCKMYDLNTLHMKGKRDI